MRQKSATGVYICFRDWKICSQFNDSFLEYYFVNTYEPADIINITSLVLTNKTQKINDSNVASRLSRLFNTTK